MGMTTDMAFNWALKQQQQQQQQPDELSNSNAWHAATGTDAQRYKQMLDANNARIAELKAELAQLTGQADNNQLTDLDLLDLELASNRANAYDLNGATTALSRIDSRMSNRAKQMQDEARNKLLKDYENDLKLSSLHDQYNQLMIKLTGAKTPAEAEQYRSQLVDMRNQITALGGTVSSDVNKLKSYAEVMDKYYNSTVNTANGRKFVDEVDDAARKELVAELREIGEIEKADALEAMKTTAEKQTAKKLSAQQRAAVRAKAKKIADDIQAIRGKASIAITDDDRKMLKVLEAEADSLVRNFGNYVKLENKVPVYTAKD